MPKERWNVLILDTLLAIVGFVRFVNDTGNYLTIKRKVLASLTSSLESLIIYQAGRFTRVYNRGIVSTLGVDISLKYYIYISAGMQPIHRERSIVRSGTIAAFRSQSSFASGKQLVLSRFHTDQPTG